MLPQRSLLALRFFVPKSKAEAAEMGVKRTCDLACGAASLGGLAGFVLSWGTALSLFGAGLPILRDGYERKRRWVKGQLLDTGAAHRIQQQQRTSHLRRLHRCVRARLQLRPQVGPGGGGLTLVCASRGLP